MLNESKPKIGWIHGITICVASFACAYFTMMVFSSVMIGDYVNKVLPSVIITPILMSAYGIWFLFSQNRMILLKKIFFASLFLILFIYLSLKVF